MCSHKRAQGKSKLSSLQQRFLLLSLSVRGREGEQRQPSSALRITPGKAFGTKVVFSQSPASGSGSVINQSHTARANTCISLAVLPVSAICFLYEVTFSQPAVQTQGCLPHLRCGSSPCQRQGSLRPLASERLSSLRAPMSHLPPGVIPVL